MQKRNINLFIFLLVISFVYSCSKEIKFYSVDNTMDIWINSIRTKDYNQAVKCFNSASLKNLKENEKPSEEFMFFFEKISNEYSDYRDISVVKKEYISETRAQVIVKFEKLDDIHYIKYQLIREKNIAGEKTWKILWSEI